MGLRVLHFVTGGLLCLFVSLTAWASEAPIRLEGYHLTSMDEADAYAKKIAKAYLAEFSALPVQQWPTIPVVHVGDEVPTRIRWVVEYLNRLHIPVDFQHIKEEHVLEKLGELEARVAQEGHGSRADVANITSEPFDEAMGVALGELAREDRGLCQRIRQRTREFFKLQNGFTLWQKVTLNGKQRVQLIKQVVTQVALGSTTYFLTLCASDQSPELWRGTAVFASWIALNMYFARNIQELQSQGRTLREVRPPEALTERDPRREGYYRVEVAPLFQRTGILIRSVVSNFIFLAGAYGFEAWTTPSLVAIAFTNSFFTLFSRFYFEEWIANHAARVQKDGTVLNPAPLPTGTPFRERFRAFRAGPHSQEATNSLRFWLELGNGILKNMHLIDVPGGRYLFYGFGGLGIYANMRDSTSSLRRWVRNLKKRMRGEPIESRCKTWLLRPTGAIMAEAPALVLNSP